MLGSILSLFSEKKCYGCGKNGQYICTDCRQNIQVNTSYCYQCKQESYDFYLHEKCKTTTYISRYIVFTKYRQTLVKRLLGDAKYYKKYCLYTDIIESSKEFLEQYIREKEFVLVPVPLHFLRKYTRGYNQSEIIAKNISRIVGGNVLTKCIKRHKYTCFQSHLSKSQRENNVLGAFSLREKYLPKNKNISIYIVDDVISTGSTVKEIAKCFRKKGFSNIHVLALASE